MKEYGTVASNVKSLTAVHHSITLVTTCCFISITIYIYFLQREIGLVTQILGEIDYTPIYLEVEFYFKKRACGVFSTFGTAYNVIRL